MKRFILFLILFILASCTSAPVSISPKVFQYIEGKEYLGTWLGEVYVVKVEATFTEREYQFKTISSNDIWFSGTKGNFFQTAPSMILAKQTHGYMYDTQTGIGEWVETGKVIPIEWHVDKESNAIVLSPNAGELSIVLFRVK